MSHKSKFVKKLEHWHWAVVSVGISAVLQFSFISKSAIWHDEGYSLLLIKHPLWEVIARSARDVHPPLYYLALKIWTGLFGTSELAARSLSAVAMIGILWVMWLLVKRYFGLGAAKASLLLLAVAPFIIRYGQEARMYALVAFLITLATYLLVTALDDNNRKRLYLYALVMALGLYTHYYTVFMIIVHWTYILIRTKFLRSRGINMLQSRRKWLKRIPNAHWWGANLTALGLFLPWLPAAFAQFTRVQGGFWIPPVDITTIPSTIAQWLHFTSFSTLPLFIRLLIPLTILALVSLALFYDKLHRRNFFLLVLWAFVAPLAVFAASILGRPVYIDRYLAFAAVGFYSLIAVLLYLKPLNKNHFVRPILLSALVALMLLGVRNVYIQSEHKMDSVGEFVSNQYQQGDRIVAAELYVYLDFDYYNQTGEPTKLYAPGGVSGYGETSLLYDKPHLLITEWQDIQSTSGYVWVVGKTGDKEYYDTLPPTWQLAETYQAGESKVLRFWASESGLSVTR